jgi:hypothetical protein
MKVYRVFGKNETEWAWLEAKSEADAMEAVEPLNILRSPLTAVVDDKNLEVPKGVVLGSDGKTHTIVRR